MARRCRFRCRLYASAFGGGTGIRSEEQNRPFVTHCRHRIACERISPYARVTQQTSRDNLVSDLRPVRICNSRESLPTGGVRNPDLMRASRLRFSPILVNPGNCVLEPLRRPPPQNRIPATNPPVSLRTRRPRESSSSPAWKEWPRPRKSALSVVECSPERELRARHDRNRGCSGMASRFVAVASGQYNRQSTSQSPPRGLLERFRFRLNQNRALSLCCRISFSQNRYPIL